MKILILFILLISNLGFSKTNTNRQIANTIELQSLIAELNSLNLKNIEKKFGFGLTVVEKISVVKKLSDADILLIVSILKMIVLMDAVDPSRTAAQMLTESYFLNTGIYKKSFEKLNLQDQKIMTDIFKMYGKPNQIGNG